jgi:hypothetical protein
LLQATLEASLAAAEAKVDLPVKKTATAVMRMKKLTEMMAHKWMFLAWVLAIAVMMIVAVPLTVTIGAN